MFNYNAFCQVLVCCTALFIAATNSSNAQVVSTEFGQNRLQYEQKKWFRYPSVNFAFSYTEKNEALAKYVLSVTEKDYHQLGLLFEHQLKKRIEVFIFSEYSDYLQSNIGIPQAMVNKGGVTKFVVPKIKVYFNGDHHDLRKQIRHGLASVLLGKIIAGTNLQEIVQNSVLMNLPKWFVQGAVSYATEPWNTYKDDQLRDVLLSGNYQNFVELAKKEPLLAGHSLFHFVAQQHGKSTISNLLYLTRINRSVENGFLYVFGKSFYQVVGTDWFNFYSSRYNADTKKRRFPNKGALSLKLPKDVQVKDIKLSPDALQLVYTELHQGLRKLMHIDLVTNQKKCLLKLGATDFSGEEDPDYPLAEWSNDGKKLVIIYEKQHKIKVRYHALASTDKTKEKQLKGIERVLDFDVSGNTLYFVGIKKGRADIYSYNGSIKAITNDFWDEKEVAVARLDNRIGLLFTSNRNTLGLTSSNFEGQMPPSTVDLFFYDLKINDKTRALTRLTNTPHANEKSIVSISPQKFSYLSDQNGVYNRYISSLDTVLIQRNKMLMLQNGRTLRANPDSSYFHLRVDSTYDELLYTATGKPYANTDYSRNVLDHDINNKKVADLIFRKGKYHLFIRTLHADRRMPALRKTKYRRYLDGQTSTFKVEFSTVKTERTAPKAVRNSSISTIEQTVDTRQSAASNPLSSTQPDTGKIDIDNYTFQTEFEDPKEPKNTANKELNDDQPRTPVVLIEEGGIIKVKEKKAKKTTRINRNKTKMVRWNPNLAQPYKSLFKVDRLTFQLDNTPLFNGMDMFLGNSYQFQPLSFALKSSFNDLFEHFRLELGIRIPLDFNGLEYFVNVENKKNLIDQRYSFYRRSRINNYIVIDTVTNFSVEIKGRTVKHLFQTELKYPLSKFQSVRGIFSLQLDKVAFLAEEQISLQIPSYHENRLGFRLEYVFDNTVSLRLNARKGTLFKGYLDMYKPFSVTTNDGFKLGLEGGLTTAIGFDARHYMSLDNKSVFAFRLAAASSFGQQKILYSLGGVENWIFPSSSTMISLPEPGSYGLQTLAANMRGFSNNARNGSSYALANLELRIPIIEYLSRNSPRNAMLRTLQLVAFLDVGTAWQGSSPFSIDNPLNTTLINNNAPGVVSPVKVTVNYYRRPILFGYGFGVRTVLLGHYIRLDYAWGVETGQVQNPILYLSIGADF